jgi:hypothetical protein
MAAQQNTFALDVARWCEKAKDNADTVLRGVVIELLSRVVLRTPVGNPDLWKANAKVISGRQRFNADVDAVNAFAADSVMRLKYGKVKTQRHLSARTIAKRLPLKVGRGYVGGALRGSWQVTVGAPAGSDNQRVDPSGNATIAAGVAAIAGAVVGPSIFIISNKSYARRIEFEAWSKQAPAGMVRVTAAEFSLIVDEQARALPQ